MPNSSIDDVSLRPASNHPQSRASSTVDGIDATWNVWLGILASGFLILLATVSLIGLTFVRNYLRRRNRTLSDDTGIFAPRRGSKAGLDMIDHNVTVVSIPYLQLILNLFALSNCTWYSLCIIENTCLTEKDKTNYRHPCM